MEVTREGKYSGLIVKGNLCLKNIIFTNKIKKNYKKERELIETEWENTFVK